MPDAERGHGNKCVAAAVQRVFEGRVGFRAVYDLPQDMRDKLAELDRAVARKREADATA